MHYEIYDYRHAQAILEHPAYSAKWQEVQKSLTDITAEALVRTHLEISTRMLAAGKRPPVGSQTAINALLRDRLEDDLDWEGQPKLFPTSAVGLADWSMDFYKSGIGIEVAFNNASYFPWIFTRLNIAGESGLVIAEHRVNVGITVCAMNDAKLWGRMDPSVGVYERVSLWLEVMRPILPIPMALIGLTAHDWDPPPPIFGPRWWTHEEARSYLAR